MDLDTQQAKEKAKEAEEKAKEAAKKAEEETAKLASALNTPTMIDIVIPIIVTIVVFILIAFLWYQNITVFKPKKLEKRHTAAVVIVYILYILFNIWYANNLSFKVCATSQLLKSIQVVIVNFIMFILITTFVLHVLPGFLQPFSNVFGNIFISLDLFKLDEKLSYVLLNPTKGSELSQKITENPSILLNSISSQTIEKDIEKIQLYKELTPIIKTEEDWMEDAKEIKDPSQNALFIKNSANGINNLKKILAARDSVGYFCWLILAALMFMSTNASQILNITDCQETDLGAIQDMVNASAPDVDVGNVDQIRV